MPFELLHGVNRKTKSRNHVERRHSWRMAGEADHTLDKQFHGYKVKGTALWLENLAAVSFFKPFAFSR